MTHASCSTSKPLLPLLALDVGKKRIGIAVSDSLGLSTHGIACLHRNDQQWPQQTLKLLDEYACKGIVIGLAMNMDGTEGEQARDCREAATQLQQYTSLPCYFQDERLSSWTAKERLFAQGLNEKKVREKLDQTAAAVILEDFISAQQQGKGASAHANHL